MNTLGYAILSLLNQDSCSGYDLADYLDSIWPAKHSQIYPTLAKLHKKGLLAFEYVEQIGKPNKKVFSITEKGRKELTKWVSEIQFSSVTRDEFLIKVHSIGLLDMETAKKLVEERINHIEKSIVLEQASTSIEEKDELDRNSTDFAKHILHERKIRLEKEEISWCHWVLDLLKKSNPKRVLVWLIGIKQFDLGVVERMLF
ncbi:PadR family transcriptional regulator [Bacillus sp. FJAT-27231]|uniref:PadR family transcriptional regulator n=1 Tax=Bacillus sp. FJAT-27231 TaxID=1679168 RepID=UPI0006715C41|nr:PadR family transcriptional regulator [Bacillus sp. FJAT-27231]